MCVTAAETVPETAAAGANAVEEVHMVTKNQVLHARNHINTIPLTYTFHKACHKTKCI